MAKDSLTIVDNRTGTSYEVPITHGTIPSISLRAIKSAPSDFGLMTYDPAYTNTASCQSKVTFIDGDAGILRYRGYPIEQIAEHASYLETAYLLINSDLPNQKQLKEFSDNILRHTLVHENIRKFIDGFHYDAHPMGILVSTVAALSTFYPDSKNVKDASSRRYQMRRLIAKMPTLAALAYRHRRGFPYVYPDNELSYSGNFLSMMFRMTERRFQVNPVLEKALDTLFVLHADHEQNCSTSCMRNVGSSLADPYCATAAACAALYGPRHGGANEEVVKMLGEIGDVKNIPGHLAKVKAGEVRLMGFGHRVYKNYDPRAKVIKKLAYDVFNVVGRNNLIDIALELEKIALEDEYFTKRKLYPNVDFYSGIIYQAMGFPLDMFPVLFAIGRTAGWLAQWEEMLLDEDQKIARPRQVYLGTELRNVLPLNERV